MANADWTDASTLFAVSNIDEYGEQLIGPGPFGVSFQSHGETVEIPLPDALGVSPVVSKCGNWRGQCRIVSFGLMTFLNWLHVQRATE